MIRRLRLKFVAVCMALVTVVLAAVFVSLYTSARRTVEITSRQVLHRVIQEDGIAARPGVGEREWVPIQLPYFTVTVWENQGGYQAYVTSGTYDNLEDTDTLAAILSDCLRQGEPEGVVAEYDLRYLRQNNGLYQRIAFVDRSVELSTMKNLAGSYVKIGLAALAVLLGAAVVLAGWAIRPVERAWKQQRQFLSDASHELKTPLTVILSNAELLEGVPLEERPARWADNIHSEAAQMKSLVEQMLTLARGDDMAPSALLTEVSLTDIAADCALAFEPVAFEAGKPLDYQLTAQVTLLGERDKLHRVISILLDNAIKYGAAGGHITLALQKTERQARLTVSNPGQPIPPAQLAHLFERFYRADASRGEQSGFGLGLSIAAAIAAEHRGTLKAESDAVSTRFILTLPLKR